MIIMNERKIIKLIALALILCVLIFTVFAEIRHFQNRQLFEAINANDYDGVSTAIQAGANINCRYRAFVLLPELVGRNPTPLIEACYGKSEEIIMLLLEKGADRLVRKVVKGMIPKNRLGNRLITNLHIFAGAEHNMQAQQPKQIDINTLK